jgi:hypothetical protein
MLYQLSYTPKGSEARGISSCPADGKGQLVKEQNQQVSFRAKIILTMI